MKRTNLFSLGSVGNKKNFQAQKSKTGETKSSVIKCNRRWILHEKRQWLKEAMDK
jgi:hypothetical protein